MPVFQRIAVAAHPKLPDAAEEVARIITYIESQGLSVVTGLFFDEQMQARIEAGEFDVLIALGGDGTMLRAGRMCAPWQIPVLGINLGRFGFLTELRQDQWRDYLPRLCAGNYWLERRMMLQVEHFNHNLTVGSWLVLNEVVVGRGVILRPIHLSASVDGRYLTTYVVDALIAATPTGSTAYALAAGGPILPPELRNILLVPVAPHLSIERAIVLSEGSSVSITVEASHDVVLSVDGLPSIELQNGDRVDVRSADHTALFIRFQDPGYFYRNLTPHMNQNPSTGNSRNHDR